MRVGGGRGSAWLVVLGGAVLSSLACGGARAPDDGDKRPLGRPELTLDSAAVADALILEKRTFDPDECEVLMGCVDGPGERLLLRLGAGISNAGNVDLVLGDPLGGEPFSEPRCGQLPGLGGLLGWKLMDRAGTQMFAGGSADLACVADEKPNDGAPAGIRRTYTCEYQGLQAGWTARSTLPESCGWADLTGMPAGDYLFELELDPDESLGLASSSQKTVQIPIVLPQDTGDCTQALCGGICCPDGVGCTEGRCDMADLVIDDRTIAQSLRFDEANFGANDCAMDEKCVDVPGHRRLLRFTLSVQNIGGMPVVVGDPRQAPEAEWSACHEHYHMSEFANYRLVDADGNVAASGHKQAFCLMDSQPLGTHGPTSPRFSCEYQGISPGWSDSYGSGLDCQWVDISDVGEGAYFLEVEVNRTQRYSELRYDNNSASVPVYIPPDPSVCQPREEVCGDGQDQSCTGKPDDGCPPLVANDSCETAHFLDGGGTWTGSIGAQTAGAAPALSCGGQGGALYFAFTVLADEIVYLSTYGSSIDTVLRIEKDACGQASEVACSDDGCGLSQSHFVGSLGAGSYRAVVQAKDAGVSGAVKLHVQRSGCGGARHMEAPGIWEGDTSLSTPNTMTSCGFGAAPDDLWYFATCPGSSPLTISSCGSQYDTVLELRKGSCRGRPADCSDDDAPAGVCEDTTASRIETTLIDQGLWFLVVDGYLSTSSGPYRLEAQW